MLNSDILAYMRSVGIPLYFRQIANWFPGDMEEAELSGRLRLLVESGFIRKDDKGRYEVIR